MDVAESKPQVLGLIVLQSISDSLCEHQASVPHRVHDPALDVCRGDVCGSPLSIATGTGVATRHRAVERQNAWLPARARNRGFGGRWTRGLLPHSCNQGGSTQAGIAFDLSCKKKAQMVEA